MKDKDTLLLEEAYTQIDEINRSIEIKDETSLKPQKVLINTNDDGTVDIQFGNRFSLSRLDKESLTKLTVVLYHTLEDMGINIHRPTY